ncbi:Rpn family recombination-promoting nuclease/putative transposase [Oribacterium sinus]
MKKTNFTKSNTKKSDCSKTHSNSTRKKLDALEKKKIIASLTLMDDLFMQVVLEEQACTEYILQTILDKSSLKLMEQRLQKRLPNLHGRALVLDCLCTDEKGLLYNIEVQNSSAGAIPKRARYHAALMDTHTLKKGEKFSKLPESYVIFITDKDVLGEGEQLYQIERVIRKSGNLFKDGSHILYFNTARQDDNALGKLARDFKEANPKEIQSKVLSHRVASLKEGKLDREGEKKMNVLLEKYRKKAVEEGIEKGMEKGIEKGIEQGIQKGLEQGKNHLALLIGRLLEAGRMDDLKRVSYDEVYREKLLKEFGL